MKNPKEQIKAKEEPKGEDYYKQIGFMCGLEIHQRLATEEKLFCSCTSVLVDKSVKPSSSVTRVQRAVAGELGKIDKSAEFEEGRSRSFTYNIFDQNTCLVDIDEEPPHPINKAALDVAISLACSMNMVLIDELQPMRKGVVDGSDPSAFQRSILIALNGKIKVNKSDIIIPSVFLEEESCGILSSTSTSVVYNTDRLGIPLVEIDTDPNIPDPETAKAVALYIGRLLRVTGRVQRGIGSIRQDVNLSIKDGARVEIKGVQELDLIDKFLENEIKRQQNLIIIKEKLIKAKATIGTATNVTPIFKNTKVDVITYHINAGAAFAFGLKGFKGLLGFEINPNRRLGTEISDYAKMSGVHGIIHSDEDLSKYKFTNDEILELRKQLNITENDSFVIIAGAIEEVKKASELAIWRASYALNGVPKETRVAYDSEFCTSRFLRPLPTGSRMYPETDVKPITVTEEMKKSSSFNAPNLEKEREYLNSKIKNKAIVEQLLTSPKLQLFKVALERSGADPDFIANLLVQKLTELRRQGIDVEKIKDEKIIELLKLYADGKLTKQGVEEALKILPKENGDINLVLSKYSLSRISGKELKLLVEKISKQNKDAKPEELRNKIMSEYRLNIDGSELNSLIKK